MTGANAPCWPFHLALCEGKNRPARCDRWGAKGHGGANDPPHAPKVKIDAGTLCETFSRPATPKEKEGLNKKIDWSKQPGGERGGKGRGGRDGRGRGRAGQRFRQPSPP